VVDQALERGGFDMGLICSIFGHKWDGCVCKRCGENNPAAKHDHAAHSWNGCTCTKCGRFIDMNHLYVNVQDSCETVCSVCGKAGEKQHMQHSWDGDKCTRCGQLRKDFELTIKVAETLEKMGMSFNDYARTGFLDAGNYGISSSIQDIREEYGQEGISLLLEAVDAEVEVYSSFVSFVKKMWPEITGVQV